MKLKLRRIGNSYGVILPKKVLPYDLIKSGYVEVTVTDGYDLEDNKKKKDLSVTKDNASL